MYTFLNYPYIFTLRVLTFDNLLRDHRHILIFTLLIDTDHFLAHLYLELYLYNLHKVLFKTKFKKYFQREKLRRLLRNKKT